MVSFTLCLLALLAGYFIYGRFVERIFGPDNRKTPALLKNDGVDFLPLPTWKIFMIQFLNIAGLGPIFGAIMGAKFGSASFLWIVLGSIFAGATHDYLAGMRKSARDDWPLFGPYHQASDAWLHRYPYDTCRRGVCFRPGRFACQAYPRTSRCHLLDYRNICLLYACHPASYR